MKVSIVIITEATSLADAEAICAVCGWGEGNFRVPLCADGTDPATHFGLHATLRESEAESFQAALEQAPDLAQALLVSIREDASRWGHFDAVAEAAGMKRIEQAVQH